MATDDETNGRPASPPAHEVETVWGARIPARDGIDLSANLWLPRVVPGGPDRFPAILEMIPYGKDNWRRNADIARGTYLARRGYALCRVDVRGTGSSGGVALDEYTEAETLDGFDAVEWLAAQPWCTGAVGMWGISYGAFTSIQVAKLRPPHLRAIVPIQGTDDRYLTDVHYIGGCVTLSELSQYAVSQVAMNAMPPDPAFWGPALARALAGAARGDAAVADRVAAPAARRAVLARWAPSPRTTTRSRRPSSTSAAGWTRTSMRRSGCRRACTAPSRTIVGNWVHGLPSSATPGPNLDELHEMVRFFDRWLKGIENGADAEPAITWFEREYAEPEPFPEALPGRWRAASAYPHPAVERRDWAFAGGALPLVGRARRGAGRGGRGDGREDGDAHGVDRYRHRPTVGTRAALSWGAGGPPNGLARDLRPDEAFGPTYTSEPLDDALEILGVPEVVLHLSASSPVATVVVRLDRRGARRHVGTGQRRDPQPDPSPVARPPGAAGAGTGRGGPRRAAAGGLPVPARPSHPGLRGLIRVAGDLALAVRDRLRAAPRAGHAVAVSSCRSSRPPAARATCPCRRSRRRPRTRRRSAARAAPISRSGTSRTTSSRGRSRSRSTTAARTSSTTAAGCMPPRRWS